MTDFDQSTKADPKVSEVMALIKTVLRNERFNFKRYGKPSKRFTWGTGAQGMSASLCKEALESARTR